MIIKKLFAQDENALFRELFEFLLKEENFCDDLLNIINIIKQIKDVSEEYQPRIKLWGNKEVQMQKVGEKKVGFINKQIPTSDRITEEDKNYLKKLFSRVGWALKLS